MKTTRTIFAILLLSMAFVAMGNGLYFVAGGDFRPWYIGYTLETTNDNQQVNITPSYVYLLNNYNNPDFTGPWSLKTGGVEYPYSEFDNINAGTSGKRGCTNGEPYVVTYPHAGNHLVKLIDVKNNIYRIRFENIPEMTSLHIDWSNLSSSERMGNQFGIGVNGLVNLKSLYIGYPLNYSGTIGNDVFKYMSNCVNFTIGNANVFTNIGKGFMAYGAMTNDMVFPKLTSIGNGSFTGTEYVEYASFPGLKTFAGSSIFSLIKNHLGQGSANGWTMTYIKNNNLGLKVLGIGESLVFPGTNTLYMQASLHTIEFTTDKDDWIGAWNNHEILPNWFGPATAIPGVDDEATLTPFSTAPSLVYTTSSGHPKPTKLKLKR